MKISALALIALLGTARIAAADDVPTTMSFVARLANAGVPVTGAHDFQLDLFDAPTGGTSHWTEAHDGVVVPSDGVLFLQLGTTVPLDSTVFVGGTQLYLQLTIDGVASDSRIVVGSAPYAVHSSTCATATTATTATNATNATNATQLASHPVTDFQLRIATGCPTGSTIQTVNADGSVACEADANTTYTAGGGLLLAGTTFSVDTTAIQARVGGTCASGQYMQAIAGDGTVTCGIDQNTLFSAGTGLVLTGTTFSVNESAIQARVAGFCASGQAIGAVNGDGTVTCESNVENQNASAQDAVVFVSGTMRTSGFVRSGSESGTTDAPTVNLPTYDGVVHRRMVSNTGTAGSGDREDQRAVADARHDADHPQRDVRGQPARCRGLNRLLGRDGHGHERRGVDLARAVGFVHHAAVLADAVRDDVEHQRADVHDRQHRAHDRGHDAPLGHGVDRVHHVGCWCSSRGRGRRVRGARARDRRDEVRRQRARHVEAAAVGMRDRELRAVQREPVQRVLRAEDAVVLALAVAHVADQRTRDVLAVAADLMEPAGARARLDERVAAEDLEPGELGGRGHARRARLRPARDRVIDDDVLRRMAARDREVALVGLGPRGGERGGRGLVEREQHAARRGAIEAMHRIDYARIASRTRCRSASSPSSQPRWVAMPEGLSTTTQRASRCTIATDGAVTAARGARGRSRSAPARARG